MLSHGVLEPSNRGCDCGNGHLQNSHITTSVRRGWLVASRCPDKPYIHVTGSLPTIVRLGYDRTYEMEVVATPQTLAGARLMRET
jgi:hypothetical protein